MLKSLLLAILFVVGMAAGAHANPSGCPTIVGNNVTWTVAQWNACFASIPATGGGTTGALLAANNLSDLTSVPTAILNLGLEALGTSGATIPLNNTNNTFSGTETFSGALNFTGVTTSTQVSCLGLSSGNVVVGSGSACGSGGGSSAFSSLTSGTNTSAAMVVGSGGSIGVTGSGAITATAAPASGLTGSTIASGVTGSSLTSVGTIATGTWNGTAIATAHGGTGATSLAAADIPVFTGTITTGDCAAWASATSVEDAGAPCIGPWDIRFYGASTLASDNTTAINDAINYCATNLCRAYIPPGTWNITGTMTTGAANIGSAGFGFDDHGIINETSNNIVMLSFGNGSGNEGIQAADFGDMVLQYANVQTGSDPNSYCMQLNFGQAADSLYNSRFGTIQCTNAYRGLGAAASNPGAFWGNRTVVMQCKNNAGACIIVGNNGVGGNDPNNYWGNVYIDPQSTCADLYEINISFTSNTQFDNIEANNTNCGVFTESSNRGIHIRNIRSEVTTLGSGMAGKGIIQCNGGECDVDGIEIQTITLNVGAGQNAFIFQDGAGSAGWPTDHVKNVILTTTPTLTSGALWGYDSPFVGMIVTPVVTYNGPTNYSGDAYTGDSTAANLGYPIITQASTGKIGTMSASSAFTALSSLSIPTLNVSSIPTSAGSGGLYVCIDTSGNTYKKSSCP